MFGDGIINLLRPHRQTCPDSCTIEITDWLTKTEVYMHALAQAAAQGDLAQIQNLIEKEKYDVDALYFLGFGSTALTAAVKAGQLEAALMLLYYGADPAYTGWFGSLPWEVALDQNNYPMMIALLEQPDWERMVDAVPITSAMMPTMRALCLETIAANALDVLERVGLHWGIPLSALVDPKGDTALHYAVAYHHANVVDYILANDQEIFTNRKNSAKKTPLFMAVEEGQWGIAETLIKAGALPNVVDATGRTLLHVAVETGHDLMVTMFINDPRINVDAVDNRGHSAFSLAAQQGDVVMMQKLWDRGANILRPAEDGKTPLILATEGAHLNAVKQLLSWSVPPNTSDNHQKTALHYAIEKNDPGLVDMLLHAGASPTLLDDHHKSPLDLVQEGVKNGAILDVLHHYGFLTDSYNMMGSDHTVVTFVPVPYDVIYT